MRPQAAAYAKTTLPTMYLPRHLSCHRLWRCSWRTCVAGTRRCLHADTRDAEREAEPRAVQHLLSSRARRRAHPRRFQFKMPKKANKAKRGKDKYYQLAKEQVRTRSRGCACGALAATPQVPRGRRCMTTRLCASLATHQSTSHTTHHALTHYQRAKAPASPFRGAQASSSPPLTRSLYPSALSLPRLPHSAGLPRTLSL